MGTQQTNELTGFKTNNPMSTTHLQKLIDQWGG